MSGLLRRVYRADAPAVRFQLDGHEIEARKGDLLLTAILTTRTSIGRSDFIPFDRAGFCLMGSCQACVVYRADGRRVQACMTPVEADAAYSTIWSPSGA